MKKTTESIKKRLPGLPEGAISIFAIVGTIFSFIMLDNSALKIIFGVMAGLFLLSGIVATIGMFNKKKSKLSFAFADVVVLAQLPVALTLFGIVIFENLTASTIGGRFIVMIPYLIVLVATIFGERSK